MAGARAGDAGWEVPASALQVLGGIGFTWEHELHRLYKRALGIESFGTPGTRLRAEIAAALLNGPKGQVPGSSQVPVSVTEGG
jgi:alkylation response protein AidB-like acyl-CoA dehydrogenase